MFDLNKKFLELNRNIKNSQYPINFKGKIKAFYGITKDGFYRISFLSSKSPDISGNTKNIVVVQGNSNENNYWTCFDLKNDSLLSVFCTFGEDMISCVINEMDETIALSKLKMRFRTWLALFKKTKSPLSPERAKGLYGELYFIKAFLSTHYSFEKAIECWSGPEKYSKDFAIDDNWFEIKTINVGAAVVKISSIQQLSSDYDGHLIVIYVEEMSDSYNAEYSTINKLCQFIISSISDIEMKDTFLNKLSEIGYDFCDDLGDKNYQVHKVENYIVTEDFPILRERDINAEVINNVCYELVLKMLKKYLRELE